MTQYPARIGPENLVVVNCNNLANNIPLEVDPMEQRRLQRLLRNLQNLLVKFQSGRAEDWIEAAERVRSWVNNDRDVDFFEETATEYRFFPHYIDTATHSHLS